MAWICVEILKDIERLGIPGDGDQGSGRMVIAIPG
jgi:hypothetical protein